MTDFTGAYCCAARNAVFYTGQAACWSMRAWPPCPTCHTANAVRRWGTWCDSAGLHADDTSRTHTRTPERLHRRRERPENQAGRQINTPVSLLLPLPVHWLDTTASLRNARPQPPVAAVGAAQGSWRPRSNRAYNVAHVCLVVASLWVNVRYWSGPSIRVGGDGFVCRSGVLVWWGWDRTGVHRARCFT